MSSGPPSDPAPGAEPGRPPGPLGPAVADRAGGGARLPPPVPAATVVVVRDGPRGVEALMLHRGEAGSFAGMWVFPGGQVDPADADPRRPGDERAAARRAAAREASEEAGLALDPDALVALSHWTPPPVRPRRFTTWFFLAAAADPGVTVDGEEIRDHRWLRPREVIALRDQGLMTLAPPTWVTLHTLSRHGTVAELLAAAGRAEPELFATEPRPVEGGTVALWHGDAAYGGGDLDRPGPRHRLWMVADGWRYERR